MRGDRMIIKFPGTKFYSGGMKPSISGYYLISLNATFENMFSNVPHSRDLTNSLF